MFEASIAQNKMGLNKLSARMFKQKKKVEPNLEPEDVASTPVIPPLNKNMSYQNVLFAIAKVLSLSQIKRSADNVDLPATDKFYVLHHTKSVSTTTSKLKSLDRDIQTFNEPNEIQGNTSIRPEMLALGRTSPTSRKIEVAQKPADGAFLENITETIAKQLYSIFNKISTGSIAGDSKEVKSKTCTEEFSRNDIVASSSSGCNSGNSGSISEIVRIDNRESFDKKIAVSMSSQTYRLTDAACGERNENNKNIGVDPVVVGSCGPLRPHFFVQTKNLDCVDNGVNTPVNISVNTSVDESVNTSVDNSVNTSVDISVNTQAPIVKVLAQKSCCTQDVEQAKVSKTTLKEKSVSVMPSNKIALSSTQRDLNMRLHKKSGTRSKEAVYTSKSVGCPRRRRSRQIKRLKSSDHSLYMLYRFLMESSMRRINWPKDILPFIGNPNDSVSINDFTASSSQTFKGLNDIFLRSFGQKFAFTEARLFPQISPEQSKKSPSIKYLLNNLGKWDSDGSQFLFDILSNSFTERNCFSSNSSPISITLNSECKHNLTKRTAVSRKRLKPHRDKSIDDQNNKPKCASSSKNIPVATKHICKNSPDDRGKKFTLDQIKEHLHKLQFDDELEENPGQNREVKIENAFGKGELILLELPPEEEEPKYKPSPSKTDNISKHKAEPSEPRLTKVPKLQQTWSIFKSNLIAQTDLPYTLSKSTTNIPDLVTTNDVGCQYPSPHSKFMSYLLGNVSTSTEEETKVECFLPKIYASENGFVMSKVKKITEIATQPTQLYEEDDSTINRLEEYFKGLPLETKEKSQEINTCHADINNAVPARSLKDNSISMSKVKVNIRRSYLQLSERCGMKVRFKHDCENNFKLSDCLGECVNILSHNPKLSRLYSRTSIKLNTLTFIFSENNLAYRDEQSAEFPWECTERTENCYSTASFLINKRDKIKNISSEDMTENQKASKSAVDENRELNTIFLNSKNLENVKRETRREVYNKNLHRKEDLTSFIDSKTTYRPLADTSDVIVKKIDCDRFPHLDPSRRTNDQKYPSIHLKHSNKKPLLQPSASTSHKETEEDYIQNNKFQKKWIPHLQDMLKRFPNIFKSSEKPNSPKKPEQSSRNPKYNNRSNWKAPKPKKVTEDPALKPVYDLFRRYHEAPPDLTNVPKRLVMSIFYEYFRRPAYLGYTCYPRTFSNVYQKPVSKPSSSRFQRTKTPASSPAYLETKKAKPLPTSRCSSRNLRLDSLLAPTRYQQERIRYPPNYL